jgi:hypothetical protein
VLTTIQGATSLLEGTRLAVTDQYDPLVSVVRDVTQKRLVAKATSAKAAQAAALTATAESDLLNRKPGAAVRQLVSAWELLK